MPLSDICDVAYTLLLEQSQQYLLAALAAGGEDLPSIEQLSQNLQAALDAPPAAETSSTPADQAQADLRKVLGLAS